MRKQSRTNNTQWELMQKVNAQRKSQKEKR